MFRFEKLTIYQESLGLIDEVYVLIKKWPSDEKFGLTDQARRAVYSIALNIAEGTSRTRKDFCHFLDLSRGSCYECVAILEIATRRQYIDKNEAKTL